MRRPRREHRTTSRQFSCEPIAVALVAASIWSASCVAAPGWRWEARKGHREAALLIPSSAGDAADRQAGLIELNPSALGIQFVNTLPDAALLKNSNLSNGGGVALGDVDGDGWCDIYLCNIEGPNALYRNRGDWRFEQVRGLRSSASDKCRKAQPSPISTAIATWTCWLLP